MDIFSYFLRNYRLFHDIDHVSIGYGNPDTSRIRIVKSAGNDFWNKKSDIDPQKPIWKKWKGVQIPFLFDQDDSREIISGGEGHVSVNYDIVASAFYFLSGWNEYVNSCNDLYGRTGYEQSMVKKLGVVRIPVVNYYFDILHDAVSQCGGKSFKRLWNDHAFAVALTHDIDNCMSAWLEGSFSELKKGRFLSIPGLVLKRFLSEDDWFNFELISSIEKQYEARSTFFFLPEKGKKGQWKNADYNIRSKKIRQVIRNLGDDGFETGVHGSFGTHADAQKLAKELAAIDTPSIIGNRFHFLMFDPGKTAGVLEKSGISYDASLGFAEHAGFRRGTCHPFYLYDFVRDQISAALEIPLIVMDTTLRSKNYMGLAPGTALDEISGLMDEVKKFSGVFTLLWHNTSFSEYKFAGWKRVYLDILEYCKNNGAWMTTGRNIYEKITGK
ncbi:MAG: polysaccharide deacetylase family protein [Bacteroidales bacterium]|jgi:hypothetical protein|nr:polysaccharide deacetylase family protein [Bacteroidales bacterium]